MKKPDYLYHYTSVSSFQTIMENQTLMFSCLCDLDDEIEQTAVNMKHAGNYYFSNSWSSENKESKEMWIEYGNSGNGIRFSLPLFPFYYYFFDFDNKKITRITHEDIEKYDKNNIMPIKDINYFKPLASTHVITPFIDDFLQEIQFNNELNDREYLKFSNGLLQGISRQSIGRRKDIKWKFLNEWRYQIEFIPKVILNSDKTEKTVLSLSDVENAKKFKIYMDLCPSKMNNMEIIFGNKVSYNDKEKVKKLIINKGITAIFRESEIII